MCKILKYSLPLITFDVKRRNLPEKSLTPLKKQIDQEHPFEQTECLLFFCPPPAGRRFKLYIFCMHNVCA